MKKPDKHDVIIQAVEALKNCEYKATAIKVELEAQFNRDSDEENICPNCNGNWEECDECDEGYVENGNSGEFSDVDTCYDWIMERLEQYGLSDRGSVAHPLSYAEFYRDGSVDSEFTFTLMLDDPENVFLLPKVIEVFTALGEEIGNGIGVGGAGMHMALLTNGGIYPCDRQSSNDDRFGNFAKSMQLLLPALFCLGANKQSSRGMSYRRPEIGYDTHRASIDYRYGAIEFRVFDTCYDDPEQILDNLVVMSKCMRYWTTKYKPAGLEKITKEITFGNDNGTELDRLYTTVKHIDLLNAGLLKLKPAYLSLGEVKRARGLKVTKRKINSDLAKFRKGLDVEYSEYVDRFEWNLVARRHRRIADLIEKLREAKAGGDIEETATKEAEKYIEEKRGELAKLEQYINERLADRERKTNGRWRLCAD